MAIHFAGGEFEAFDLMGKQNGVGGPFIWSTTAGTYDSDYARGSMAIEGAGANWLRATWPTALTEGWLHFKYYHTNFNTASSHLDNWIIRLFLSTEADPIFRIDGDGGGQTEFDVEYRVSSFSYTHVTTLTTGAGLDLEDDTLYTFDIHWNIHNSLGEYELYIDGSFVAAVGPIDTLFGAYTGIDSIEFGNPDGNNVSTLAHISEVIVADESTIGMHLATLGATANSATNNAWTNGEPEIDDTGEYTDLTLIHSDTNGQIQGFVVDDISGGASGDDMIGVVVSARATVGESGVTNIQAHTRTGASDFFTASLTGNDKHLQQVQGVFDTNPDTTDPWTESEVNGAEFGLRAVT